MGGKSKKGTRLTKRTVARIKRLAEQERKREEVSEEGE